MSTNDRMPLIDVMKAVASQLIVFHHFSAYGPLARAAHEFAPGTMDWLFEYARMAVQVFLVVAGFLAARGLAAQGQALKQAPFAMIGKRYLRLVIPFLAAIGLAVIFAAIADKWMDDEAIPARATLLQWLAHATLLHGVTGVDSLSAGVWYVAIDFQLFALFAILLWIGRSRILAQGLVIGVAIASLFVFNRDAGWDNWAVYFFGSYGLGVATWWASDRRQLSFWLGIIATVTIAALVVDFRLRIALALAVALTLGFTRRLNLLEAHWPTGPLGFLGKISYSVFLVHFPVALLINGLWSKMDWLTPDAALGGLLVAWVSSLFVAAAFYNWIECPAASRRITSAMGTVGQMLLKILRKRPAILRRRLGQRT